MSRLPWRRRRKSLAIVVDLDHGAEARKARAEAEARWELVQRQVREHRDQRRRNNFGIRMGQAFGGHRA